MKISHTFRKSDGILRLVLSAHVIVAITPETPSPKSIYHFKMEQTEFYNNCRSLMLRWQYARLIEIVRAIPESHPDYWTGQYVLLESYMASVDLEEAERCFHHAEQHLSHDHPLYISFELRYHFIGLQTYEAKDMLSALQYFEAVYEDSNTTPYNKALSLAYYGKALLLGISFGRFAASQKQVAIRFLKNAAAIFQDNGFVHDFHNTLLYQAETIQKKPMPDPEKAAILYQHLLNAGAQQQDGIISGTAQLALAVLAFEKKFGPGLCQEELSQLIQPFDDVLKIFEANDHLVSHAIVERELGHLLLDFGIEDGINHLERAYTVFESHGFFVHAQSMLRSIASWHLQHGRTKENLIYDERADQLNEKVKISFGDKVSCLARIVHAHRTGEIGAAREIYEEAQVSFADHPLRGQLDAAHARNLQRVGLVKESIKIYRELVERSAHLEVSSFLSDDLTNLATSLQQINPDEACKHIAQSIKIDELLEDPIAKVQHIIIFIQILTEQARQAYGPPLRVPPAIDTCFEECARLLKDKHKLDAWIKQGEVLQAKGLVFFLSHQFDKAVEVFESAEKLFESLQIPSHASFLFSHLGMSIVELARRDDSIALYDKARKYLQDAYLLFEEGLQKAEQARLKGLIGICDYESGRLEKNKVDAFARWAKAEVSFEEAYQHHRYLRIHTDHSSSLSRQRSMMAYGREHLTYPMQAFYMHHQCTKDAAAAVKWMERTKGQALIEALVARSGTNSTAEWSQDNALIDVQDSFTNIVASTQEQLTTSGLVVQYFCLDKAVLVYGIRKEWTAPKVLSLPILYTDLMDCADLFFTSQYGSVRSMMKNDLEQQWQAFRTLLTPIENWAQADDIIYFVPHAILHRFPLHTLKLSDGQYLIERYPVSYAPSLSILSYKRTNLNSDRALSDQPTIFGDSRNNLAFAKQEAIAIADLLHVQPHLGEEVTRRKILAALTHGGTVHICCHGELMGKDGWEYGMQIAEGMALTASDVFPIRTTANLVVLSGCETGVSEYTEGDELTGLIRAFLHAGTPNLIVSQWKVDDAATADLFRSFYAQLIDNPQLSKVRALQLAMCQMKQKNLHFYYWGAFQIFTQLT